MIGLTDDYLKLPNEVDIYAWSLSLSREMKLQQSSLERHRTIQTVEEICRRKMVRISSLIGIGAVCSCGSTDHTSALLRTETAALATRLLAAMVQWCLP